MNIDIYRALDFKEKVWADLLGEILSQHQETNRLMKRFVEIMEQAEEKLVDT